MAEGQGGAKRPNTGIYYLYVVVLIHCSCFRATQAAITPSNDQLRSAGKTWAGPQGPILTSQRE